MKHSYHAHHASPGARGSLLLGLNGVAGGFVADPAGAGTQDFFVGYRYAGEPWTLLPFLRETTVRAAGGAVAPLPHGRYGRTLGWATDRWMAQALVFLLATPFDSSADPAGVADVGRPARLEPAVHGLLDFDNSHMDIPVELVCAIADDARPWRVLRGGESAPTGARTITAVVADDEAWGLATGAGAGATAFCGADLLGVPAAGLLFRIAPAGKAVFPLVFGFGRDGVAALGAALAQSAEARALAQTRDAELRASGLSEDARRSVSLATRELIASAAPDATLDLSLAAMRRRAGV